MSSKHVLMVTYHFPPDGGSSGVLRPLKFAKYLPKFGWIPHILTVRPHLYECIDASLEHDVSSDIHVHRTPAINVSRHLALAGRYPGFLAVPDRMVGWIPFAVRKGLRLIETYPIKAIVSTAPPPSVHLIGYWLSRRARLPWIADYRDPWVDTVHPPEGSVRRAIETRLERRVLEQADRIVATTPALLRQILDRYPQSRDRQGTVIYNGFDEADFSPRVPLPPASTFELLHAGLVTKAYRNPEPLMRALAHLIRAGHLPITGVRLTLLGGGEWLASHDFARMIRRQGLEAVVRVEPRVSHEKALARMEQAAVLLAIQASDDTRDLIPAKVFEYLRVGRPLLVMASEGETARVVRGFAGCRCVEPSDHDQLCAALVELYRHWQRGDGQWFDRDLSSFHRATLTGKLAELLQAFLDPRVHRD